MTAPATNATFAVFGAPGPFTAELQSADIAYELCDDLARTELTAYGAVLVLADRYPEVTQLDHSSATALSTYVRSGGRAYVEYAVGGVDLLPTPAGPERVAHLERIFGADSLPLGLQPLTILDEHASRMLPVQTPADATELLSYGVVAGSHTALFGPPDDTWPALLEVPTGNGRMLYATTSLNHWKRGRYRPAKRWRGLVRALVALLADKAPVEPPELFTEPRVWVASGEPVRLVLSSATPPRSEIPLAEIGPGRYVSEPMVLSDGEHTFEVSDVSATVTVGPRLERYRRMVDSGIEWFNRSGMFFGESDGSAGVAEGFSNDLGPDGAHEVRPVHRGDGYVQVAHAFRQYGELTGERKHAAVAENLLRMVRDRMQLTDQNLLYGSFEPRGARTDLTGTNNLFADDNGWISLFSLLSGQTQSGLRGVESLLRTANAELGLQADPWRTPSTIMVRGWDEISRTPISDGLDLSSHWQSSALSAYLVAYGVTGETRYLEVATRGLDHMAAAFPRTRLETSRTCEAIRFVLPLAAGYFYTGKQDYLDTLRAIATYLRSKQDLNGGFVEWDGKCPPSNEAYGVDEAAIFAANGDRITDQLYATGFAALSLPVAHRVTGDPLFGELGTGVLDYLARIQLDEGDPRLDGTWMRAFDLDTWEYFGSNADVGWGPYCVETGWSHAPSLIGAMLHLTGDEFFPAVKIEPEPARAVRAEFDDIAARRTVAPVFRRGADGRVVREQGTATALIGDLVVAGEPVWVRNAAAGAVEIYARGIDGHLHHTYLDDRLGQGRWQQVGELRLADEPTVAFNPGADAVEVYALGTDCQIHHTSMIDVRAAHTPWETVGQLCFQGSPTVRYDEELRSVRLIARCTAGQVRRTVKVNRWHLPWQDYSHWVTA